MNLIMFSASRFLLSVVATACLGIAAAVVAAPAAAQVAAAPDPTTTGPYKWTKSGYQFEPAPDPLVREVGFLVAHGGQYENANGVPTELWASIWRPTDAPGPRPVIVMLHGNHNDCGRIVDPATGRRKDDNVGYSTHGVCPDGYVPVPSHDGFDYLAQMLATHGYFVISINSHLGIGSNVPRSPDALRRDVRMRARLVLSHLNLLDKWNTRGGSQGVLGFDMLNQLDFKQIGLLGHSMGGLGMRHVAGEAESLASTKPNLFDNKPAFRGLFEIAPVDLSGADANNMPWSVLLPTCDADVRFLEGQRPFDRMIAARAETVPTPKSMFVVEGANHAFYNSQWHDPEHLKLYGPPVCYSNDPTQPVLFDMTAMGSEKQRTTALYPVAAFFRAYVGAKTEPELAQLFDPAFRLPEKLNGLTRFRRTFTANVAASGSVVLDDFKNPIGSGKFGIGNEVSDPRSGLTSFAQGYVPEHDPASQFGILKWDTRSTHSIVSPFYQANATPLLRQGLTMDKFQKLEFRVGLGCEKEVIPDEAVVGCQPDISNNPLNPGGKTTTDFSIALVLQSGILTKQVNLSTYAQPLTPVGLKYGYVNAHPTLQSVRIPLADFNLPRSAKVRGVRLIFNKVPTGKIYLGNIRFAEK
jgi:hypothetical protein